MTGRIRALVVWGFLLACFVALYVLLDDPDGGDPLLIGLITATVLFGGFVYFVRRQQVQQGASWMTLARSRARRVEKGAESTRFADVGGLDEAKAQLQDVVSFLNAPTRWEKAGVRLPRGVLLEGPPGSGKTLLARAVAGEAGVAFFELSASEFVEMFVGVGAARVRDTFEMAAKAAPAVLFIDELDAIGRRRGSGIGGSHDEREQTLNQLLVCLDGFAPLRRLVVMAATNRADILDQALLRPGRFDIRVSTTEPGLQARIEILRVHTRKKALAPDVGLDALAARLEGWSGAGIEGLVNEAAMRSVRRGDGPVTASDIDAAITDRDRQKRRYDAVDALLTESASQLARPQGKAVVEVELDDGARLSGAVVWADATFLKLETDEGSVVVAKRHMKTIRAGAGTVQVPDDALSPDRFGAGRADVG